MNESAAFATNGVIQELTLEEIEQANGGIVPLVLAAAVLCTAVEFSFIAGVFDGIAEKATRTQ